MISNAKTNVSVWRLPRAGTCGVPEADAFFAAFDGMCEVLEKFAGEIPANYRARIEAACADFVAVNEKMGITPFCILDFERHIDHIVEHELDDFTEEEKYELYKMDLLDHRRLFEQMVSVYADKEIADKISYYRDSEASSIVRLAETRPEEVPDMKLSDKIKDKVGWHRAAARLLNGLKAAFPDGNMPVPLFGAAAHLRETAESMVFDTYGVYTRRNLAERLSRLWDVPLTQAEGRIKQWEETGRIRRVDYQRVLHAWDGGSFYDSVTRRENQAVCDAICLEWNRAVDAGLVRSNPAESGDGLEI